MTKKPFPAESELGAPRVGRTAGLSSLSLLVMVACASKATTGDSAIGQGDSARDPAPEADTDDDGDDSAETDTGGKDTDTGDPLESLGFDFDGTWYDLLPSDISCQQYGGIYAVTSSGEGNMVSYVYFGGAPEPGDYALVEWTGMASWLEPGTAGLAFVSLGADATGGNSTGKGGSMVVTAEDDGTTLIAWTDAALESYGGDPYGSASGLVACH